MGRPPRNLALARPGQEQHARSSSSASCGGAASASNSFGGLRPEERYLLDTHGFVCLKGVLSQQELAATRSAFDRTRGRKEVLKPWGVLAEPALEALVAHPGLLPALCELGAGEPHLVNASCNTSARPRAPPSLRGLHRHEPLLLAVRVLQRRRFASLLGGAWLGLRASKRSLFERSRRLRPVSLCSGD